MKEPIQESEPIKVEYDRIEETDEYAVGIMHLEGTDGRGEFEFRVHGPMDDVLSYGEEAVIQQLELRVLDEGENPLLEHRQSTLESHRGYWDEWLSGRCEALHRLIGEADLDLLADVRELSVRLALELFTFDKPLLAVAAQEPDLTRDRLCKIVPLDLYDVVGFYLRFQVHPTVSQGKSDYYVSSRNSNAASAHLTCFSGDPDLYLYRGNTWKDSSARSTCRDESVHASGGSGDWRVRVYGYTTAQYELSVGWI